MSPVGGFPGMMANRRRTVRAPINPIDKATIVSIFPKPIDAKKISITPGRFFVPAGTYESPAYLTVGPSSWWKEVDEEQPLLEIPCPSNQVADAIVKDHCNGLLGCNMSTSMPGIFWIPGEINDILLRTKHKVVLENAKERQTRFWHTLIRLADSFWARTNGNPLCISDEMRLAAKELKMEQKEWMANFQMLGKINCKACGSPVNPLYPVCPACKCIWDTDKAKELNIQFAQ